MEQSESLTIADGELLSTTEVARALRVSTGHVRKLVRVGVLHGIRLVEGGHYRFRRTEVEAFIEQHR